ncbi:MAG TPA: TIGR02206 family membrane protein [Thermoleophilaceae bacterium]|nr:TIGR02206 family membrane protein [Thermoleophilaceae bacterium]
MELLETEHVAAVAATAVLAGLAVLAARTWSAGAITLLSRGLALLILVAYATDQVVALLRGDWSADRYLPFHLTDSVTIVAAVALWTWRPLPVELTYFWALTASLQAVLTPDLGEGFPDAYFWTYFVTHSGAVVAACLLVFGVGLRPGPGAVRRAFVATACVAGAAALANLVTGGNYMYLRDKPDSGSLLDLMGPWPWYIVASGVLALVLFALLDAPFRRRRS